MLMSAVWAAAPPPPHSGKGVFAFRDWGLSTPRLLPCNFSYLSQAKFSALVHIIIISRVISWVEWILWCGREDQLLQLWVIRDHPRQCLWPGFNSCPAKEDSTFIRRVPIIIMNNPNRQDERGYSSSAAIYNKSTAQALLDEGKRDPQELISTSR